MSLQVSEQVLVERLEQENFLLMNELNRKDIAINALISELSMLDTKHDYLEREHKQIQLLAIEIMKEG